MADQDKKSNFETNISAIHFRKSVSMSISGPAGLV